MDVGRRCAEIRRENEGSLWIAIRRTRGPHEHPKPLSDSYGLHGAPKQPQAPDTPRRRKSTPQVSQSRQTWPPDGRIARRRGTAGGRLALRGAWETTGSTGAFGMHMELVTYGIPT